jgi:rRNA-processing protein FCF1
LQEVIFDSSFLMAVVERPTTWFEDMVEGLGRFEPTTMECVEEELGRIASRQGRRARDARVAMELANRFGKLACGGAGVDEEIVSAAVARGAAVATTDAKLADSLRSLRVRVISLAGGRVALG